MPHLGWNNLVSKHPMLNQDVYFVHSYQAPMSENVIAYAQYGADIPAIVQFNNYIGIQFHPEKKRYIWVTNFASGNTRGIYK